MPACTECGTTFVRQEHLTRHRAAIHDRSTCFTCENCHRSFTRSDSFRRHCRAHGVIRPIRKRVTAKSSRQPGQRACQACECVRAKCSGGIPCSRCSSRGLTCILHTTNSPSYQRTGSVTDHGEHQPDESEPMLDTNTPLSVASPSPASVPGLSTASPPEACLPNVHNQQLRATSFSSGEHTPFSGFAGQPSALTLTVPVGINVPPTALESVGDFLYDSFDSLSNGRNWLPPQNPAVLNSILADTGVPSQQPSLHDPLTGSDLVSPARRIEPTYPMAVSGEVDSEVGPTPARSHGEYSAASEETGDTPSSGLYIDGNGSRAAYPRHPALPRLRPEGSTLVSRWNKRLPCSSMVFGFPPITNSMHNAITYSPDSVRLNPSAHLELLNMFDILAGRDSLLYPAFGTSDFPSLDFVEECLNLFIEGPSQDIPIIHVSTWHNTQVSWLLILAAAAVGSLYHPIEVDNRIASTFQELTRRAIRYTVEKLPLTDNCVLRQACLLNVCLAGQVWESSSLSIQNALTELMFANQRSFQSTQSCRELQSDSNSAVHEWNTWIIQETRRRLDYFTWQTRFLTSITIFVDGFDMMDLNALSLPCPQTLWELTNANDFQNKLSTFGQSSTMHDALQSLYVKRRIPQSCSGRGLIPLIYGIVNRTFEVSQQLRQPLKQWMPVSQLQEDTENETHSAEVSWLPANATYAAWRNSGCDCLDLLHWQTHVEIASAIGLEGPQVTHLHLARLLLLTPFNEMISLARNSSLATTSSKSHFNLHSSSASGSAPSESPTKDAIMRWITLDDHKGRLSLIHAGAIFWHIRRYARGSFYEPFAVFLATLVLWLYGHYEPQFKAILLANKAAVSRYQRTMGQYTERNHESTVDDSRDANDTSLPIVLDRPCDDEIVQLFIREGHMMDPQMFRAVRICSVEGSRKVLDEGIKLLSRCQGSSNAKAGEYADILVELFDAIHTM